MARKESPIRQLLNPRRIIVITVLAVAAAAWLMVRSFDAKAFEQITWSWGIVSWLVVALLAMGMRDLAYMLRLRVLTNKELSWRRCFEVIFLWEFASSITPSVVGGAPIAIFLVNKEGINLGKATTIVLITSLLDELFFILMVPLVFFLVPNEQLFHVTEEFRASLPFAFDPLAVFYISYGLIVLYSLVISFGLFVSPQGLKTVLSGLFRLPILRRWREGAERTGDEIVTASKEVKKMPFSYWFQAGGATFFSWTARYLVINFILMAFFALSLGDNLLIYARELVMWIIMLISPPPGGSGVAEIAFDVFLGDFTQGLGGPLAVLWRLFSYFPYIFIGIIILPRWIQRVYLKRKLIKFKDVK